MKNAASSPTSLIIGGLAARAEIVRDIEATTSLEASAVAERARLECDCALDDPAALTRIGQLQVICALTPRRRAGKEELLTRKEAELVQVANDFISGQLSPRVNALRARAAKQARAALAPHISDLATLNDAVERSDGVVAADRIRYGFTITSNPPFGSVRHAESVLRAWADCDSLEAKLS